MGALFEKGECKLSRRSASETKTGSGVGTVLNVVFGGGGIVVGSKGGGGVWREKGEEVGKGSNFSGLESTEAIEGCVIVGAAGLGWGERGGLALLSEVYITATLVEGEFMVPVRDQPMAIL